MNSARYQNCIFRHGNAFLLILLFLTLFNHLVHAQPPGWDITYFTTEDGLTSNLVNWVAKDNRGFIWVGTENGLNRFDGYTFTTLKLPDGNSHPLSMMKVLTIYEDKEGILWFGTSDGLFRYNPLEPATAIKQYRYIDMPEVSSYRIMQPIVNICEDKNGLFWVRCGDLDEGVFYGVHTFDREKEAFDIIWPDSSVVNYGVGEINNFFNALTYSDSRGNLWFASQAGLLRYDFENRSFEKYIPFPESQVPRINRVLTLFDDDFGNFWTSNDYGLYNFDRDKLCFDEQITLDAKKLWKIGISSVIEMFGIDYNGYLWMRTAKSLVRILTGPGGYLDYESLEKWDTDFTSVRGNALNTFLVESPWIVWLALPDIGLCRVTVRRNDFKTIRPTSLYKSGVLDLDHVYSLMVDKDDRLLISVESAVINYNTVSKERNLHTSIIPNSSIGAIETDRNANLWFASRYGTVARVIMNREGEFESYLYQPDQDKPFSITRRQEWAARVIGSTSPHLYEHLLFRDRDGTLWFNSGRGIHDRYDADMDGFVHLDHRVPDYVNNDTCVEAEVTGEKWFPSSEGLLRLLPPFTESAPFTLTPGATILYRNASDDRYSLSSDWLRTIYFSKNHEPGTLWVGTIGGGLNKLVKKQVEGTDRYEIRFRHYTTADGLCDNNVLGIIEDRRGYLWLSTMNGLSRFDPRTEEFHNFYRNDGLPSNNFSWADPGMNSKGELFFPTDKGVLHFQPDSIRINQVAPPVHITGFQIYNEPVYPGDKSPLRRDISAAQSVKLSYRQNFLSFEYAALNFEQPQKNLYRYLLEGFDRDWIHSGTRRYVEYKGLKPGSYTFRVQGSNNSGVWNEAGASLEILIKHPPWQKWWAYVIYFLLFAGALLWYRRFLLNREKLKAAVEVERVEKEKIQAIDSFRSRFFTNISHEFRTPLTLVAGPLEDSLKATQEPVPMEKNILRVMLRNTRRLQRLINQLLDISRIESGSMKLMVSEGPLPEFVRFIAGSFSSLAESGQIDFIVSAEETDGDCWFDPDKLEKILCNLLSNAFKFTPDGGSVVLELRADLPQSAGSPHLAVIRVSDTGIGIDRENLHRVFDRFYQVSDSDTREEEGTGIGLALTRELVELMHGEIRVESEPGKGTTFTVTFPVARESFSDDEIAVIGKPGMDNNEISLAKGEQEVLEVEKDAEDITGAGKGIQHKKEGEVILVVEDNDDLRMYISEQFRRAYRVVEANNGQIGMEKAIEHIPDLVVADIMMAVMDGVEMCRRIKSHPATNHIPVIMLTAKADKKSKLTGLEAAADDYIVKPFDSELLLARAKNLINQRKELRRHFEKNFLMEGDPKASASPEFHMLREVLKVFERHLSEPDFNIDSLGKELNMSRAQTFRKVLSVTGNTPNNLLRMVRMKHAARLLRSGTMNITQVMYSVGMQSPSHFASSFRKYFGVNPKDYGKSR